MTPASLKGQLRGRAGISAGLLALLASTFLCFGVTLRATDAIPLGSPVFWLAALALAAALWVAFLALGGGLRSLVAADPVGRRMRERAEGLRGRTRVVLAAGGACCALCWVVALLAAWPGYFCYDTGEIRSFVLAGTLSDAQSVLHELFAGGVIRGALAATGSWNASIATFVVVQAAIELAALLYALDRMARWGGLRRRPCALLALLLARPLRAHARALHDEGHALRDLGAPPRRRVLLPVAGAP